MPESYRTWLRKERSYSGWYRNRNLSCRAKTHSLQHSLKKMKRKWRSRLPKRMIKSAPSEFTWIGEIWIGLSFFSRGMRQTWNYYSNLKLIYPNSVMGWIPLNELTVILIIFYRLEAELTQTREELSTLRERAARELAQLTQKCVVFQQNQKRWVIVYDSAFL